MKLNTKSFFLVLSVLMTAFGFMSNAQTSDLQSPIVDSSVIFEERKGLVAIEAEHFYKQTKSDIRQWYITSKDQASELGINQRSQHHSEASNKSYIEILPDTRVTHSDELIQGENFTNQAGFMGIVHYRVQINNPGRYYVWVRAFSTGTEDNGIHVGYDGRWPENGQRMQWCDGKEDWTWDSKQRTKEEHCGVPNQIYLDIEKAGVHDIQFSMREDGFEFDKFVLSSDINYVPDHEGPKVLVAEGKLPETDSRSYFARISSSEPDTKEIAAQEFPIEGTNFYAHGKNWLAIHPEKHKKASASVHIDFESGNYDIVFVGVGENDGQSSFVVLINDKELGAYQPPLSSVMFEEGKNFNALWENVSLKKGDKLTVVSKIGSADGKEYTRGRWAGVVFTAVGKGRQIQDAPSSYSPE